MTSFLLGPSSSSLAYPVAARELFAKHLGARVPKLQQLPWIGGRNKKQPVLMGYHSFGGYFGQSQKPNSSTTNNAEVNTESEDMIHHHLAEDFKPKVLPLHESLRKAVVVFFKFLRIHGAVGKVLTVISISFITAERLLDITPMFFVKTFEAVVSAFLMSIYIGGVNEIADIEIDKINKPHRPLAAGELSVPNAIAIVSISTFLSFLIVWRTGSWPFFWAIFVSFLLGTSYSLDVLFLPAGKKNSLTAALYMVANQALVVPVAFMIHAQTYIHGRPALLTRPMIFATTMMTFFSSTMSIFKDIPDIEGDRKHGIKSLAIRLGPKKLFWSCTWFLLMAFGVAIFMGISSPMVWSKYVTVSANGVMALVTWIGAKSVDLNDNEDIQSFYMFIWKLFCAECLVMPFVR